MPDVGQLHCITYRPCPRLALGLGSCVVTRLDWSHVRMTRGGGGVDVCMRESHDLPGSSEPNESSAARHNSVCLSRQHHFKRVIGVLLLHIQTAIGAHDIGIACLGTHVPRSLTSTVVCTIPHTVPQCGMHPSRLVVIEFLCQSAQPRGRKPLLMAVKTLNTLHTF